jgi:hypothetical protein
MDEDKSRTGRKAPLMSLSRACSPKKEKKERSSNRQLHDEGKMVKGQRDAHELSTTQHSS